ncbi:MAG: DUF420 domain-containing protein [Candidatus Neomarinimicrobiota bacterium]
MRDRFWVRIIFIVSGVILAVVAFLILGARPGGPDGHPGVSYLPHVNAALNGITSSLLLIAYVFIKRKKVRHHRNFMQAAFGTSALFLASYMVYHWFRSGPTSYGGQWPLLYYSVLVTHIILAAVILPLALVTLYRGWTLQVAKHRSIARITLPLWLYVSLSGIVVYLMLYS